MDLITLKLILVVGLVVGLGIWQLYDVNRELRNHPTEPESGDAPESHAPAEAQLKRNEGQAESAKHPVDQ